METFRKQGYTLNQVEIVPTVALSNITITHKENQLCHPNNAPGIVLSTTLVSHPFVNSNVQFWECSS